MILLRPPLVSKCDYDYMSGSQGSSTPLRYDLSYRNYYYIVEGEIRVKLIPPIYSKYLLENKDFDNFEFRSPINPWNVDENKDYNKVKSLEIIVNQGFYFLYHHIGGIVLIIRRCQVYVLLNIEHI